MRTLPRHQSLDDFPLPVLRGQPFIYDFWHHESIRVFTRSRSISSFVTIAPLRAKGRKPRKASLAVPPFEVPFASVRPRRASSERIRPAVLCSRRANSLAACRTSSSISRVVLIHLMIKHQNKAQRPFTHSTLQNGLAVHDIELQCCARGRREATCDRRDSHSAP
jgi:hypothetical protein